MAKNNENGADCEINETLHAMSALILIKNLT